MVKHEEKTITRAEAAKATLAKIGVGAATGAGAIALALLPSPVAAVEPPAIEETEDAKLDTTALAEEPTQQAANAYAGPGASIGPVSGGLLKLLLKWLPK
jgi:hypothetical protein